MPTYDYECKSCKEKFELFQKISDDPITHCPKCNGKVKRLIGGGLGIIFKGSGFYSTDNKKSNTSTKSRSTPDKSDNNSDNKSTDTTVDASAKKETKQESKDTPVAKAS
ncbi:MAG: zinc ribbon domain-containing protein [Spirochaetales bacterium]|nr:zinc ribbon domain-containing protein [Spirochaetales bacterium]